MLHLSLSCYINGKEPLPYNYLILKSQRNVRVIGAFFCSFLFLFIIAVIIPFNHVRIFGSMICHSPECVSDMSGFSRNFSGTTFKSPTTFH